MTQRILTTSSVASILVSSAFVAGCASGGATAGPPAPAIDAPLPGDNYAVVYEDAGSVMVHDTRTGAERAAITGTAQILASAASMDGGHVAVAFRTPGGTRVMAFDAAAGSWTDVGDAAGGDAYTLAWSVDGTVLGIGVQGATSGVYAVGEDGTARSIGCSASDRFAAWRSPTEAVVHDERNFYTVRASDCGTLARFTKVGHPGATFAPNGQRVAYYVNQPVRRQGGGTVEVPELWIAGHDGNGARKIADYQSRPSHFAWAPDASKLVYEVESRRWANTSHLLVFDVRTAAYTYIAEEKDLGVPSDFGACWAPGGTRFAHERLYGRSTGTQQYSTRQIVVRTGEEEAVVFDEVVDMAPDAVRSAGGETCRWLGERHVLVPARGGYRIIDVEDGEIFTVPEDRHVLSAAVFDSLEGSR